MVDHLKNVFDHYTTVHPGKSILKNFFVGYAELSRFLRPGLGKLTIEEVPDVKIKRHLETDCDNRQAKIPSDVQGSYTGRGETPYETPVQDADDL